MIPGISWSGQFSISFNKMNNFVAIFILLRKNFEGSFIILVENHHSHHNEQCRVTC